MAKQEKNLEPGSPIKSSYHLDHEKCIGGVWFPAGEKVYLTDAEAETLGLKAPPRPSLEPSTNHKTGTAGESQE